MNTYQVIYEAEGEEQFEDVEATNAGQAFAKCQQGHPGAKMLSASREGGFLDGYGKTEWKAPPIQRDPVKEPRPLHAPRPEDHEGVMPFYDEVVRRD